MIYNEKTQPINKMAHKMFCNAKTILVLGLILFCSSMIMAQTSPNGYSFEHSWEYYSNFIQPNQGGYTQLDHIGIQLNANGDVVTPNTVQVNSDSLVIRTHLNDVSDGRYYIKFWISKQIDDEYVNLGSYCFFFIKTWQDYFTYTIPAPGNGSFTLSYRLYYENGRFYRRGHHVFEKTSSHQFILINNNQDVLFKLRSADTNLKRPMLLVEGYDPLNSQSFDFYNGLITEIESNNLGVFDGIDLFFLDFRDATIDLRENAMVVLGAIQFIKTLYPTEALLEGISVLGFSMGGVLSRYALAYAEHNGIAHHCTQLITYDSPHRGAVINTSLQNAVYRIYNKVKNTICGVNILN